MVRVFPSIVPQKKIPIIVYHDMSGVVGSLLDKRHTRFVDVIDRTLKSMVIEDGNVYLVEVM
jgi:hypothetical protein